MALGCCVGGGEGEPGGGRGRGDATVRSYDGHGRLLGTQRVTARAVPVSIAPGGFTLVRR